jgi:dipeptidyl aminopeptidase/acylaminoacyl peptidase
MNADKSFVRDRRSTAFIGGHIFFHTFFGSQLVALFFLLALAGAHAQSFTIDQALSAPFPSDLTAAPAGDKIAWVFDARGVRNVWVAESPDFKARQLTHYTEDDGQEIGDLAWSGDGAAIAYTRGGEANGRGEIPNPTSNSAGARQEVYLATLAGGEPRLVGTGSSPAISPDGKTLVYINHGQIWSGAQQLIHARGTAEDIRWSPDNSCFSFTSVRADHSFIGVYTVATKDLRFLDPSVDWDGSSGWSPDGTSIAFRRIPAARTFYDHAPRRTAADPWSIRVADVKTGVGREVWRANAGTGSAAHDMVADNQLFWGAGDRIVFAWEGDGWLHLYSVEASGGNATLLTPGEFEIERAVLTPDRASVMYSSNQADIDRRHLWRVPVSEAKPVALTHGDGIEFAVAPLAGGTSGNIALLHCDAKIPARPAVLAENQAIRDIAPETMPGDFPSSAMVTPRAVMISSADGIQVHGQLLLPPGYDPSKKYPAVVFFHGGSRRQMLLGWHYMFYYHQAYGFNQYLASKGYIVLTVNYRSGVGYGLDFREAKDYGPNGASEYNDVIGAGLYLRGRGDVDAARIGLWGGSYGGYLTALGLARASDMFAAGVDLHGVHDWNLEIRNAWPAYQPQKQEETARIAFESSPMAAVAGWRSPVLLIQGDDDRNVVFSQTVILAEALRKQKVHFEQMVIPDEIHDFLVHDHWLQVYRAADRFLSRYLLTDAGQRPTPH